MGGDIAFKYVQPEFRQQLLTGKCTDTGAIFCLNIANSLFNIIDPHQGYFRKIIDNVLFTLLENSLITDQGVQIFHTFSGLERTE